MLLVLERSYMVYIILTDAVLRIWVKTTDPLPVRQMLRVYRSDCNVHLTVSQKAANIPPQCFSPQIT